MNQWMGDLFFRGASPTEIAGMAFHELRYWERWHRLMTKAEKDATRGD